ncbi:MAG: hypothetical protein KIC89_22390 [Acetobacteraceae bacterium]|nr:hypothetical protein [Acetobacteraceae bacterium]
MSRILHFPEFTLEEKSGGVVVQQGNRSYLARRWSLTADLMRTATIARDLGFPCVIRAEKAGIPIHPSGDSAEYIGFSRQADERWIFVADQFSGRPNIDRVTIEKGYRGVLERLKLSFIWETAGGKNLFLSISDLPVFLDALDDETIRLVESGRRRKPVSVSRLRHVGVVSEADLQGQLIQQIHNGDHADLFGKVLQINVNPIWLRPGNGNLIRDGRDIPDLVIGTETHAFIMELKKAALDPNSLFQLRRYLHNSDLLRFAGNRSIVGLLVGERIDEGLKSMTISSVAGNGTTPIRILLYKIESRIDLRPWISLTPHDHL